MATLKFIFKLISDTSREWATERVGRLGAALAYYALFSIAPLLVILIAIGGAVYGEATARGQIISIISHQIGTEAASTVAESLSGVRREAGPSLLTTLISAVILVFSATNLFGHLRDALNTIWNVRRKPHKNLFRGFIIMLRDRFLSAVMVIVLSIVLLATLALSASLTVLGGWLKTVITPNTSFLLEGGNILIAFGLVAILFAIMFKILPDAQVEWRVVWVGAAVASLLFNLGAFFIGLYLGYGGGQSLLGAAGSLVVLMIWISYSAQVVFFGAKFALVYASAIGKPIRPAPHAAGFKLSWLEAEPANQGSKNDAPL